MPLRHSVDEIELQNGMRGILIDVPDSTVFSYEIHFRAGDGYVTDMAAQQTAHIMEHMVFGPNKRFASPEAFSQEFTKNGAYQNATTWQRNMSYYADGALMEWDRILELQAVSIAEPKFLQKTLDAEKGNVKEEMIGYANAHNRVMWMHVQKATGEPSLLDDEALKTVDAVTLDHIKRHHALTHTARNMRFSVAGDLSKHKQQIIDMFESWALPQGERLPVEKIVRHSSGPVYLYRKDLANLIFGIEIVLNRELSVKEMVTMGALRRILTGSFHSRIFGKARKRGLCYGMRSSSFTDIAGTSTWELYGQVGLDNASALFKLIISELKKVISGEISEQELSEAKQFALGDYQMKGQTVGQLSSWYSSDYFDYEKITKLEDMPQLISGTTNEELTALAQEFIEKGEWTLGGIGSISEPALNDLYMQLAQLFPKKVE